MEGKPYSRIAHAGAVINNAQYIIADAIDPVSRNIETGIKIAMPLVLLGVVANIFQSGPELLAQAQQSGDDYKTYLPAVFKNIIDAVTPTPNSSPTPRPTRPPTPTAPFTEELSSGINALKHLAQPVIQYAGNVLSNLWQQIHPNLW